MKKKYISSIVIILLLMSVVLTGCQVKEETTLKDLAAKNQKTLGIKDANKRMKEITHKSVDSSTKGKWKMNKDLGDSVYTSYISTNFTKNKRKVFVVLEYVTTEKVPFAFVGSKYFQKGDEYKDNYRM